MTPGRLVLFVAMPYLAAGPIPNPRVPRVIDPGYFFRHKEDDEDRGREHCQDQLLIGDDGDD